MYKVTTPVMRGNSEKIPTIAALIDSLRTRIGLNSVTTSPMYNANNPEAEIDNMGASILW